MKKNFLKDDGFKWLLVMLLLAALMIAVMIYYNRRIKIINDKLRETSIVKPDLRSFKNFVSLTAPTNNY